MKTNPILLVKLFLTFFTAVLVLTAGSVILCPQAIHAQDPPEWPSTWTWLDDDTNDAGTDDHRDVIDAYWSYEGEYLFLRLLTVDPPTFENGATRYKWLIDTGTPPNIYDYDNRLYGSEYILLIEDGIAPYGNEDGEVYVLMETNPLNQYPHPDNYDPYHDYEQMQSGMRVYQWDPVDPTVDPIEATYRFWPEDGNIYVDMKVKLSELGQTDPYSLSVWWATDQMNNNLEQSPDVDFGDTADWPITLSRPTGLSLRGVPAFPSIHIGIAAALGVGILVYFMRRRLVSHKG